MTVGEFIKRLQQFPDDWPVHVVTPAGGGLAIEHRQNNGKDFVGVYGSNGGRIGENPLTDVEYAKQKTRVLELMADPIRRYTSIHGDHRWYDVTMPRNGTQFGWSFDRLIIERMVDEGLIDPDTIDIPKVRYLAGVK